MRSCEGFIRVRKGRVRAMRDADGGAVGNRPTTREEKRNETEKKKKKVKPGSRLCNVMGGRDRVVGKPPVGVDTHKNPAHLALIYYEGFSRAHNLTRAA